MKKRILVSVIICSLCLLSGCQTEGDIPSVATVEVSSTKESVENVKENQPSSIEVSERETEEISTIESNIEQTQEEDIVLGISDIEGQIKDWLPEDIKVEQGDLKQYKEDYSKYFDVVATDDEKYPIIIGSPALINLTDAEMEKYIGKEGSVDNAWFPTYYTMVGQYPTKVHFEHDNMGYDKDDKISVVNYEIGDIYDYVTVKDIVKNIENEFELSFGYGAIFDVTEEEYENFITKNNIDIDELDYEYFSPDDVCCFSDIDLVLKFAETYDKDFNLLVRDNYKVVFSCGKSDDNRLFCWLTFGK